MPHMRDKLFESDNFWKLLVVLTSAALLWYAVGVCILTLASAGRGARVSLTVRGRRGGRGGEVVVAVPLLLRVPLRATHLRLDLAGRALELLPLTFY